MPRPGISYGTLDARYIVKSGITTWSDGVTIPADIGVKTYQTANTGATTITNITGGIEGREIRIYFGDSNTTIEDNSNIYLQGELDFTARQYSSLDLFYDGTRWVECGRLQNRLP